MNLIVTDVYGFKLLHDSDFAAVKWAERPTFEDYMRPIIARHKGLFIDGGCNAGFHTLSAVQLGLDVIAVDANFLNAALAQKTIDLNNLNDRVKVLCAALGDAVGTVLVSLQWSNSNVEPSGTLVAQDTIDSIVEKYSNGRPVSLIKLDIEGYEKTAIEGATETIKKFSPTILVEHCMQLADTSLFGRLDAIGYDYKVVSKNEQPFTEKRDWVPENVWMYECTPRT